MFDGYIFADPGATGPEMIAGTENSIQSNGCSYDVGVVTETKHHKIIKRSGEGHIEFSIIKLPHGPTGTNVHQVVVTWAMEAHPATLYLLKSSCGAPCIGPCADKRSTNAGRLAASRVKGDVHGGAEVVVANGQGGQEAADSGEELVRESFAKGFFVELLCDQRLVFFVRRCGFKLFL